MEMPEQLEMLISAVHEIQEDQKDTARFQGKVEGSVRVLHFFVTLGTSSIVALCVIVWNASTALSNLKDKLNGFDPVKVEMKMDRVDSDVTELKQRVINLEHPQKGRP